MKHAFTFLMILISGIIYGQNNALNFDGIDDYITTTVPAITGNASRTYEAWIRTTANANPGAGGVQKVIVEMGTQATGSRFTMNLLNNNGLRIEVQGGGVNSSRALNDGLWHHVAAVYNAAAANPFTLYVDGVLDTAGNIPGTVTVNTTAGDIVIGRRADGIHPWEGDIDEVRIWNVARSAAEIQANYNISFCTNPSSLVGYFKFNQGTSKGNNGGVTTIINSVSGGGNGSFNNFTLTGSGSNFVQSGAPSENVNIGVSKNGLQFTAAASNASFQWLNCPSFSPINGANTSVFNATANGQYAVAVTQNGCIDTSICYAVTGVGSQNISANAWMVYPNPVSERMFLRNENNSSAWVDIFNAFGQCVHHQNITNGVEEISMTSLPSGILFVVVRNADGVKHQQKILHQ